MNTQPRMTPEVQFCLQVLFENGITDGVEYNKCLKEMTKLQTSFKLVPVETDDFFTELATKMRELWPSGKKDGKYDWRESVPDTAKRLKWLWEQKHLDRYTIEDCLLVCRKYLASYHDSTKYMKLLKYFIIKRKGNEMVSKDGRINYSYESEFANMLETLTDEERQREKDADIIESMLMDCGGTLV